jgi:hypothetical protein
VIGSQGAVSSWKNAWGNKRDTADGGLETLAFTPDGHRLVAMGKNGVRAFDATPPTGE